MPSSGPRSLPARRRPSLAAASSNNLGFMIGIELRHGPRQSYVKILIRYFAVSSMLVIDPLDSASCSSAILAPTRFYVGVSYFTTKLQMASFHTRVISASTLLRWQAAAFEQEDPSMYYFKCSPENFPSGFMIERDPTTGWRSWQGWPTPALPTQTPSPTYFFVVMFFHI